MNVEPSEHVTTSGAQILVLMHVVKVHNVELETMVPFVPVQGDLLEIQQLLAALTEIVDSPVNVVAAMLSESHDIDDSLMTTSHHSSRMLSPCTNKIYFPLTDQAIISPHMNTDIGK